jgi:hypothetical protein
MNATEIQQVLADNPQVDSDQLVKAMVAIRELRSAGVIGNSGYRLSRPFTARRKSRKNRHADDPRAGRLKSQR